MERLEQRRRFTKVPLEPPTDIISDFGSAVDLVGISTANAYQTSPHLQRPTYLNVTQNAVGSGFTANSNFYDYTIYSYNNLGQYSVVYQSSGTFTDNGDSNPYSIVLDWDSVTSTSRDTIAGYYIGRSINASGFNYLDVGNVLTYEDSNASFMSSAPSSFANDYIATGTFRSYQVLPANFNGSPSGTTYFGSTTTSYGTSDDGLGNAYNVFHSWIDVPDGRIIGNSSGSGLDYYFDSTSDYGAIEDSASFATTPLVITPTTYGIVANGSNLSLYFKIYTFKDGFYSADSLDFNTTDPNDSAYYIINLSWTYNLSADYFKILKSSDGGMTYDVALTTASTSIQIDAFTAWDASLTVTPVG